MINSNKEYIIYIGVTLNQLKATKNLRKQIDRQECDAKDTTSHRHKQVTTSEDT